MRRFQLLRVQQLFGVGVGGGGVGGVVSGVAQVDAGVQPIIRVQTGGAEKNNISLNNNKTKHGPDTVLPGFTGFYWVLLGFTGFLLGFT